MVMLGATPPGRLTEQHDIFFGIGSSLKDLVPQMKIFWPEAKGKIHIDAWREVNAIDGFQISVIEKNTGQPEENHLFFINLGGYKKGEFEEYHYKILAVAPKLAIALKAAKATSFYKHFGFKGAESHIDEKYGIDVDDVYKVADILDQQAKEKFTLKITQNRDLPPDELHIGYVGIEKLLKS